MRKTIAVISLTAASLITVAGTASAASSSSQNGSLSDFLPSGSAGSNVGSSFDNSFFGSLGSVFDIDLNWFPLQGWDVGSSFKINGTNPLTGSLGGAKTKEAAPTDTKTEAGTKDQTAGTTEKDSATKTSTPKKSTPKKTTVPLLKVDPGSLKNSPISLSKLRLPTADELKHMLDPATWRINWDVLRTINIDFPSSSITGGGDASTESESESESSRSPLNRPMKRAPPGPPRARTPPRTPAPSRPREPRPRRRRSPPPPRPRTPARSAAWAVSAARRARVRSAAWAASGAPRVRSAAPGAR